MLPDEEGRRIAHSHLEDRCASLTAALAASETARRLAEDRGRRDQDMIEALLAALAVRDGVPVAVERLRWIPHDRPCTREE